MPPGAGPEKVFGPRVESESDRKFREEQERRQKLDAEKKDAEIQRLTQQVRESQAREAATVMTKHSGAATPSEAQAKMMENMAASAEAMSKVAEQMQAANERKDVPRSTIRVEPNVKWPHLGDDGPGGDEVERFFEKFEEVCSLANNGIGMPNKEIIIVLKNCLHGSRRTIYDNILKEHKPAELLETPEGARQIYEHQEGHKAIIDAAVH